MKQSVKLLTLSCLFLLTGCAYTDRFFGEDCKTHAYLETPLSAYLTKRFNPKAPVRLGIVPYSAPANLAGDNLEFPGIGLQLAAKLHQEILASGTVPIVEVFNREDWPGKKEEFATGNFGAISFAREAGYDLVLVGLVQSPTSLNKLSAYTKLIEPESGTTLWYGETTATSGRDRLAKLEDSLWIDNRDPAMLPTHTLVEKLGVCIAKQVTKE